ncbi:MAG: type II-A CRISPR-associated protein Csn2 [Peptostreptococcus porci]|nr:type II-A CRISPR-associated protein Csn2 [Peptostreptococcus porci]
MKLVNSNLEMIIDFEKGYFQLLTIENKSYYRKFIYNLINQIEGNEGNFCLSNNDKILDMSKQMVAISDIFNIDINSKKIKNKLISIISNEVKDSYDEIKHLIDNLENSIDAVIFDFETPIYRKKDIFFEDLLKLVDIEFEKTDDVLDTLLNYIELCSNYLSVDVFVFFNLSIFFTEGEFELFCEEMIKKEYYILDIESEIRDCFPIDSSRIVRYIIDIDLCEI